MIYIRKKDDETLEDDITIACKNQADIANLVAQLHKLFELLILDLLHGFWELLLPRI
jgi:hypothetical protein